MQYVAHSAIKSSLSLLVCRSTQSLAAAMADSLPEGHLIRTEYQSQGRGQYSRHWESSLGKNLLFTILLRPTFLETKHLFLLSMAAILSLLEVAHSLNLDNLYVKWPNDLYVGDQKLSGVLLESKLQAGRVRHLLLGVGLNVNQQHFSVAGATSLARLVGKSLDRDHLLEQWGYFFASFYEGLRKKSSREALCYRYQSYLLGRAKPSLYKTPNGDSFSATLLGVDMSGYLSLQVAQEVQRFSPGSLHHLAFEQKND